MDEKPLIFEDESFDDYYIAQHMWSREMKYHKDQFLYKALPEEKNPEMLKHTEDRVHTRDSVRGHIGDAVAHAAETVGYNATSVHMRGGQVIGGHSNKHAAHAGWCPKSGYCSFRATNPWGWGHAGYVGNHGAAVPPGWAPTNSTPSWNQASTAPSTPAGPLPSALAGQAHTAPTSYVAPATYGAAGARPGAYAVPAAAAASAAGYGAAPQKPNGYASPQAGYGAPAPAGYGAPPQTGYAAPQFGSTHPAYAKPAAYSPSPPLPAPNSFAAPTQLAAPWSSEGTYGNSFA